MPYTRPTKLDPPVDPARDHLLGEENAELALVEYGNYARDSCHAAHEVVAGLRDRFGSRMRYVFRHRPAGENNSAVRAAELAEFASATTGRFWPVHDALMKRGPAISASDLEEIAREFNLPSRDGEHAAAYETARRRVQEDRQSAKRSGVIVTQPSSSMAAVTKALGMRTHSLRRCSAGSATACTLRRSISSAGRLPLGFFFC